MTYDADRPMAGHRSATSLSLVFFSIAPVTLGSLLFWGLLDVPTDGDGVFIAVLVGGVLAAVAPYAIGWERGVVALLIMTGGVPWLIHALRSYALGWRISAAVLLCLVVSALTWWSLRLGHVRRPSDAKQWREKRDDSWPYPYA